MIKILLLNLILFTTLSLVNCGGSAGAPTEPPSGNPSQNQTDPNQPGDNSNPGSSLSDNDNVSAPTPHSFDETLLNEGTYDGEIDANGKFTGWGVWVYHNIRYEGYFENGVPNGEGALYVNIPLPVPFDPHNQSGDSYLEVRGTFVNGSAHGLITYIVMFHEGSLATEGSGPFKLHFDVDMGVPVAVRDASQSSDVIFTSDCGGLTSHISYVGGVPPFAFSNLIFE
ncbi:MAG: hypothetical protein FWD44_09945 [Oscillospiraceae bacterium]|nr:hypothetical protein [Oscillospiraceae bacterium]